MPSKGGLTYHLTCLLNAPYIGKLEDPKNHEFSLKLQISIMVSIAVSKMGLTALIFVVPGMKVNGQYYHDVLLCQQMLLAINHVARHTFVFEQDNAPFHRAKDTIKQPQQETPDFIVPDLWPPNSPDLSIVDYKVWGVMQQTVYECRMNSVNELKLRLIDV